MVEWIALALAADSECKSSSAQARSKKALRRVNEISGDPFIIVRPVKLKSSLIEGSKGFWRNLIGQRKLTLSKKPVGTFSIRRSDIKKLAEYKDDNGVKYVAINISDSANIWIDDELVNYVRIPGSIEQVTSIINGVRK